MKFILPCFDTGDGDRGVRRIGDSQRNDNVLDLRHGHEPSCVHRR